MKAVFLVIDYVPHQILSIKSLIEKGHAEILAYHVGRFIQAVPENLIRFSTRRYNECGRKNMLGQIVDFKPDIVVVAGWMIKEYVWIAKQLKKRTSVPIVAMSDTPWYGRWRQRVNTLISPFHLKKAFTHLWVAGIRQYDYARKLGFKNGQIIFNSLCGDTATFSEVDIETKKTSYPKKFLFVGRFEEVKGLHNIIEAWGDIRDKKGWTFTLVGQGSLKKELQQLENVIVKDYMSQKNLVEEFQKAGCFVLPSLKEPWALVIHEAAIAGLPIVCTQTCGAAPHFVISNYNGFVVENSSAADLKNKLERIINMDETELLRFSEHSRILSGSITPEIQVASLLQLINQ